VPLQSVCQVRENPVPSQSMRRHSLYLTMNLKTHCLGFLPLGEPLVQSVFDKRLEMDTRKLREWVRSLCLSHERLRAELEGLEAMGCPHCGPKCDLGGSK
jgi:hypothetical protein